MASLLMSHVTATVNNFRYFVTSNSVRNSSTPSQPNDKPEKPTGASGAPGGSSTSTTGIRKMTALSGLQSWALVFSGRYKSKAEIPEYVPYDVLTKAQSKARIKLSNILMAITMAGCLIYAYSGRKAAQRGESVSQMNLDWHKDYKAQIEKENKERKS